MSEFPFWRRVQGRYRRTSARMFYRRPLAIKSNIPLISFTFDDFPRSALHTGGAILSRYGGAGTYYASFGLMDKQAPTGTMFVRTDVETLLKNGHELGCHTFGHCDAAETEPKMFEKSVIQNQQILSQMCPETSFQTLSYPLNQPRARTKQMVERHFACCRGGGQKFNMGIADLNCLTAYFLEQSRDNPEAVKALIDQNQRARGWLIFATHDVCDAPSPWGCTPLFFEEIVHYSANSGARILPVVQALEALRKPSEGNGLAQGSMSNNHLEYSRSDGHGPSTSVGS